MAELEEDVLEVLSNPKKEASLLAKLEADMIEVRALYDLVYHKPRSPVLSSSPTQGSALSVPNFGVKNMCRRWLHYVIQTRFRHALFGVRPGWCVRVVERTPSARPPPGAQHSLA